MFTQVTNGIKISVHTTFEGTFFKSHKIYYTFGYTVTIENLNRDTIQLMTKHWDIFDALKATESIGGEGVLGRTPRLKPGDTYTYGSGCMLASPIGAMRGYYQMVNLTNIKAFKVEVPTFKLTAPFVIN